MKKIKLAVLAVCLLTGVIGAYGTSKKATLNFYWAVVGTPTSSSQVQVAGGPPSGQCSINPQGQYICRFSTEEILIPGDYAWVSEIAIDRTYGN